jgi:hypothetical protein
MNLFVFQLEAFKMLLIQSALRSKKTVFFPFFFLMEARSARKRKAPPKYDDFEREFSEESSDEETN